MRLLECPIFYADSVVRSYRREGKSDMSEYFNVADIFGENVFSDKVMQDRLPKKIYKELHKTIDEGKELDPMVAEVVAEAMKQWAVEKGATHYTHWFQPLTGVTAEKHDSFITAPRADGTISKTEGFSSYER